jgi:hypothetical protein
LVVGNDEQLSCGVDGSDTNSKDGKSRYSVKGVVNGPCKICVQRGSAGRFTVFGTSNSINNNCFTIGLTIGITDWLRWCLRIFDTLLVMVTIGQYDHDFLITCTN